LFLGSLSWLHDGQLGEQAGAEFGDIHHDLAELPVVLDEGVLREKGVHLLLSFFLLFLGLGRHVTEGSQDLPVQGHVAIAGEEGQALDLGVLGLERFFAGFGGVLVPGDLLVDESENAGQEPVYVAEVLLEEALAAKGFGRGGRGGFKG